ncbi:MAG TPA: hypothetical protein VNF73_04035 [Candidatus Saccharimonadales bacterium]|nr:hypothetical protein [Candidatus Saccharimonadales bacterium]
MVIPVGGLTTILTDVRLYGQAGLETGAMLLGRMGEQQVDIVALLGERGIERHPDHLVISGVALATLFDWADDRDARVLAQLHSHGLSALMSVTDQRFGLTVEGFTSAIVPEAACPPADPSRWGWWMFRGGLWEPSAPARVAEGSCLTVVFDESGVRDG